MLCTENLGVMKGLLLRYLCWKSLLSPVFLPMFCVGHFIPACHMWRVCFLLCLLLHTEGCEEQEILFCSLCNLRLAQGPCPGRLSVNAEERSGQWSLRSWYAQVDISAALCILSLCLVKGKNSLWTGCGGGLWLHVDCFITSLENIAVWSEPWTWYLSLRIGMSVAWFILVLRVPSPIESPPCFRDAMLSACWWEGAPWQGSWKPPGKSCGFDSLWLNWSHFKKGLLSARATRSVLFCPLASLWGAAVSKGCH